VNKLTKFDKNIPKKLDSLKVCHKIESWRFFHNFINFLSEIKNPSKAKKTNNLEEI
jgi:hypothetical protein